MPGRNGGRDSVGDVTGGIGALTAGTGAGRDDTIAAGGDTAEPDSKPSLGKVPVAGVGSAGISSTKVAPPWADPIEALRKLTFCNTN